MVRNLLVGSETMPTSTLAFAEAIGTRPGPGAGVNRRVALNRTAWPLADVVVPALSRYRAKSWPGRFTAIGVTIVIHVLLTALVIYDWRQPQRAAAPDDAIVVTLLPPAPDEPAKREERGGIAAKVPPSPALAELPSPIAELPKQPVIIVAEPAVASPPVVMDGGRNDRLAQSTQTYRQAIMAQLAAQRSYPRRPLLAGYQGAGTILFHIDRDGRLLDAVIETSTGLKALDRAALALVRRAAPFPIVPAELPDRLEVSLPIRFMIVEPNTMMMAVR